MAVTKESDLCLFCKSLWCFQKLPSLDLSVVALQWELIPSSKAETAELNRISAALHNLKEHFSQLWPEVGSIAVYNEAVVQLTFKTPPAATICQWLSTGHQCCLHSTSHLVWSCRAWISTKAAGRQMMYFSYSVMKHILWTFISHSEWV